MFMFYVIHSTSRAMAPGGFNHGTAEGNYVRCVTVRVHGVLPRAQQAVKGGSMRW